jgi:hypothetical protein
LSSRHVDASFSLSFQKSPISPPANLTSVSEESPSKASYSGSRRESEEKNDIDKENVESRRSNSLEVFPSKEAKTEDTEVEAINSDTEGKVVMRQKRLGSSSPTEKDKEHRSLLLEMKRKSFNKSLESVTDKELKPTTPSPEQVSEFSKAFDKFKRRSVYSDDKTQQEPDSSTSKDGALVEKKPETTKPETTKVAGKKPETTKPETTKPETTKVEPKSPGGKIRAVNISMFEKSGNTSSPESKSKKDQVNKREESPTKGSQPWRSKTAPVDPVAFKVAQSKSSDALSMDKQPLKRVSSHEVQRETKQSNVKAETKRFSAVETGPGGGEPAWISLARKKQKDPVKEDGETKTMTMSLSTSPPKSPVPKSPLAKSPMFETENSGESGVPSWKAQLKKNKEDAMKAKVKDETKTENVPSWKRQQQKSPERKVTSEKTANKNDDQNVPAWKRQSKVQEKTAPSNDSNKTQTTSTSSIVKRFSKNFEEEPKKTELIEIKSQKRGEKVRIVISCEEFGPLLS